MPRRPPVRDWNSTPNDLRTRKNHLITMTDEAWEILGELVAANPMADGSRSKMLEVLVRMAAGERPKKRPKGP